MGVLKKLTRKLKQWVRASGDSNVVSDSPTDHPTTLTLEQLQASLPDATDAQRKRIHQVQTHTMTSPERILSLIQSVEYLQQADIPGDIVECGVWRGGSMAAAALTLKQVDPNPVRQLILYDTFSGMSAPSPQDVDCWGTTASEQLARENPEDPRSVWCVSQLDEVKHLMGLTGYDSTHVHYRIGKVEDTLFDQPLPDKIALLRLDTDWYESTRIELEQLYPRLVPGGVLIIDDYGHWQGCRRAVDEYFTEQRIPLLLHRIDYTGRIGVKPLTPSAQPNAQPSPATEAA